MKRRWRNVPDEHVRHRWDLKCGCPVERTVYVEPDYYQNGIPICEECGQDRIYVETQMLR